MVDPSTDRACKNCREAKPLSCSRCQKAIPTEEVFEREKLKTKKPIFCLECGEREEVVKCGLCNLNLQRHQAKQVSNYPAAKNYHPHCLRERQKQLDRLDKVLPIMALVGLLVGGLIGKVQLASIGSIPGIGAGAVVGGGICYLIVSGLKSKLTPK
ncbi:MAG: hypothetical protein U0931_03615 [Vulcanimicrobiota bacterium]